MVYRAHPRSKSCAVSFDVPDPEASVPTISNPSPDAFTDSLRAHLICRGGSTLAFADQMVSYYRRLKCVFRSAERRLRPVTEGSQSPSFLITAHAPTLSPW